jgi:vacuolar-type H+-ATPase subunit H
MMGRKDVIDSIKLKEAEIDKRIEAAKKRSAETNENAKKEARNIEEDSLLNSRKECEEIISTARKAAEGRRRATLEKGGSDAEKLRKTAGVGKAKDFFMERFNERTR